MKTTLPIIFLLLFLSGNLAFSARVNENTAQAVAINFLKNTDGSGTNSPLSLVYTGNNETQNLYYVFGNETGFVIVAADDRIEPILGYSKEGRPFLIPKTGDMATGNNFWGWMKSWENQIKDIVDTNITATSEISSQWQSLTDDQGMKGMTTVIPPLLTTTWDQGWPYNAMCPSDVSGPGGHVWAGCVATAMAQILKYHSYPSQGLGSYGYQWGSYPYTSADFGTTTYNWSNMPNNISTTNNDIATIIYQTAVSCRSMWGSGSTGVLVSSGQYPMLVAWVNYFKYAFSSIKYLEKINYTATQWDSLLQVELLANRPIYYRGDGSLSHAWVCDGIDASNMYHFNWGWGGNYNGYFALSNLNPGGNNLTSNQHAIIGIKPNDGSTLVVNTTWSGNITNTTNIAVPDAISLTVSPGAIVKFGKDCKLQIWGKINSVGTSTNYAKFTAINTSDGWDGFEWYEDYLNRMSDNDSSKLIYTQVEYSKSSGIYCSDYGKILIDHSKINNNYGYNGGGISIFYSPINIVWSEIYNNNATSQGAGIFLTSTDTTSAIISQNNLHDNVAGIQGAGFFLSCYENVVFENNIIGYNQAIKGAGGMLSGLSPLVRNNKFCNNSTTSSSGKGGGLYLESCNAKVINNLFANNFAKSASAMYITNGSNSYILNNTISMNHALNVAGAVIIGQQSNPSNPIFKNTIIFGNTAVNGYQIFLDLNCQPVFDHCDIQDGLAGFGGPGSGGNYTTGNYTNNIDANPLFVNPSAGAGNGYNGLTADWTLQFTPTISPCINTGDTTGVSNLLPALDLGGNPRINGIIDMGAYEYSLSIPVQLAILNDTVMYGQFACYSATQTITVAGGGNLFKVSTGGSAELIAGQKISYLTGTMVEEGGYMLGYISPVGPWCKAQVLPLATTISNEEDGLSMPAVSTGILVFPNPTTGEFTLSLIGYKTTSVAKVSIYGLSGEKILESSMEYGTSRVFSLAGRASGVYYFRVKTGNETIKGKIVKL